MTDTPSSILLLRLQSTGSNTNLWGGYLNAAMQTIERASKGYQALAVTGDATVSWSNYSPTNDGAVAFLKLTGSISSSAALTFPGFQHFLMVWNAAGQPVTIKCSGGTGVTIPNGRKVMLACDGTDYFGAVANFTPDSSTLTNNGDLVNYQQMAAAISALLAGTVNGLVLNSAADTSPSYLASKLALSNVGLLIAALATGNPGSNEFSGISIDDRRLRRRLMFAGQV